MSNNSERLKVARRLFPDRFKVYARKYYLAHQEVVKAKARDYELLHKEELSGKRKVLYSTEAYKEGARLKRRKWIRDPAVRASINEKARKRWHENYRTNYLRKRKEKNQYGYIRPAKGRYKSAILFSEKRGIKWTIPFEVYEYLITLPCHYCGGFIGNHVGLDRVDHGLHYFRANVVPCCGICNRMRGVWLTKREMEIAMKAVLEYRKITKET